MTDSNGTSDLSKPLFLDFEFAREDSVNSKGIPRKGLDTLLASLRKKHGPSLFGGWNDNGAELLLDYVVRNYFPEKLSVHLYISNLSVSENYWRLMFRLPSGPRLQRDMPEGLTAAFIGEVGEKHSENPRLTVRDIKIVAATECLPFEREIQTELMLNQEPWQGRERGNILSKSYLQGLPCISKDTRKQLGDWRDYLAFKKNVVNNQELGVRYLACLPKGEAQQVTFVACCEQGNTVLNRLKKQQLGCFPMDASEDENQFKPSINQRVRSYRLGDYKGSRNLNAVDVNHYLSGIGEAGFSNPQFSLLTFDLDDDDREKLDKKQLEPTEIDEWIKSTFPPHGFVAISTAGDKAQISRHERALKQLEQQSGYNPMLSAFLFDIQQAGVPNQVDPLPEDRMNNRDLNGDQKACVEKMLAAPDICMVQGPPGTGKTTVIAEAVYQMVRRGDRVLLVSQAHLAVDNALERLPLDPSIRAVRLGQEKKISEGGRLFTRTQVLKRFYQGIADKVQQGSLGIWHELENRQALCRQYIEILQGLVADLEQDRKRVSALEDDLTSQLAEVSQLQKNLDRQLMEFQEKQADKQRASSSLQALADRRWDQCHLPDTLVSQWPLKVMHLVQELRQSGLTLGLPSLPRDHDAQATKLEYCRLMLQQSERALAHVDHVREDLKRLQCGEGLEDTATALEIARLQAERGKLTQQMQDGDDGAIDAWREVNVRLSELEGQKGGLECAVYQSLIADDSALLSRCSPEQALAELEPLVVALELLERQRPIILAELAEQLRDFSQQPLAEPSRQPLTQAQSEVSKTQRSLQQWREHAADIESKLDRNLQQASAKSDLPVVPQDAQGSLERLRELEESCQRELRVNEEFRRHWQPLLRRWHSSLTSDDLGADNEYFLQDFVPLCNLVAITCNERDRTLEEIGAESFDTVIIDEVSKATPPELLMPIMRARRVILVGDHRQLPPVFQERYDESWEEAVAKAEENGDEPLLTRRNLKKYEKMVTASLFKQHFEQANDRLKTSLFTQYRMHPQIMDLINVFYENRLTCGLDEPDRQRAHGLTIPSARHRSLEFIRPDTHAYWVDSSRTPNGQPFYELQAGTSKVNPLEVALIVQALRKLNEAHGEKPVQGKKRVGVISFYGRQVRDLRQAIKPLRGELKHLEVDVNTVDRFQGKEEDVIMVSMVRNTRSGRSGSGAYVAQFERINVALSRARQLLMIFGASEMFRQYEINLPNLDRPGSTKRRVYADIIERLERSGAMFASEVLLHPDSDREKFENLQRPASTKPYRDHRNAKSGQRQQYSKRPIRQPV